METSLTDARIRAMTAAGYWRNESLADYLDRWARERPGRTALVGRGGSTTWEELAGAVDRVANGLAERGVGGGSVIACQLPNWIEAIVVFLAALRLGAVINPIPPTYRASELRFMLGLLETQVAVVPAAFRGFEHAGMLAALRPELPRLEHVFVVRCDGPAGALPLPAPARGPPRPGGAPAGPPGDPAPGGGLPPRTAGEAKGRV